MAIRGASWWIALPGWGLFHWHNHRNASDQDSLAQCGANAETTASLSHRQMNGYTGRIEPMQELHFPVRCAFDWTWQEINEKGRRWYISWEQLQVQRHQDGEEEKVLAAYSVWMAHMLRQVTVIKRNTIVIVFAFLLSCHNIVSLQSWKNCQHRWLWGTPS